MREVRSDAGPQAVSEAVATHGLTKRYGSVLALQDCSLSIPEGSVAALIGPNGAGKTTLLQLLAGLSRPTAGEHLRADAVNQLYGFDSRLGLAGQPADERKNDSDEDQHQQ